LGDATDVDEFRRVVAADEAESQREEGEIPNALTDPVLAELWDNPEDAEYDDLVPSPMSTRATA